MPLLKRRKPANESGEPKEAEVKVAWDGSLYVDAAQLIRSPSFKQQLEEFKAIEPALLDEPKDFNEPYYTKAT